MLLLLMEQGKLHFFQTDQWQSGHTGLRKDTFETSNIVIAGNLDVSYTYKIIGKPELTCGMRRKYTLIITDNAGNESDNAAFTWNVVSDFEVEKIINGNQITGYF